MTPEVERLVRWLHAENAAERVLHQLVHELYTDWDDDGNPFFNPDKEWDGDTLEALSSLIPNEIGHDEWARFTESLDGEADNACGGGDDSPD